MSTSKVKKIKCHFFFLLRFPFASVSLIGKVSQIQGNSFNVAREQDKGRREYHHKF